MYCFLFVTKFLSRSWSLFQVSLFFDTGSVIYNKTDGDGWCYTAKCITTEEAKCDVAVTQGPCPTTLPLTTLPPTTLPPTTSGNCDYHVPPLKVGTFQADS